MRNQVAVRNPATLRESVNGSVRNGCGIECIALEEEQAHSRAVLGRVAANLDGHHEL